MAQPEIGDVFKDITADVQTIVRDQIELAKLDLGSGFKHHMIPVSWVDHVDEHVHLNLTKDEAKARWTEKPH